ncbi:MauE/DoxX family redox-associated membrane protein [Okeania sp.]|uniref:TlpA family protein disulfide reductase n=1 Tax=Okeania sp. TaxID=3100323 RepID=UPI002B4AB308|nr:MauE/DoxX family redox-associated membrane protein [Okeania sp.]MEB3342787.1 MauE/DoxX family redox-associated membrane protein [Okeania sp.]
MILFILTSTTSNIVGIIFLLTGIAKVIEPWKFTQYITKLNLINSQLIIPFALTFTAIESALGVGLILGVFPTLIMPISILLLFGLSILTYWSTSTGKTEDCGCYNGWLEITPTQSLILNTVYIFLLLFTEFFGKYQPTIFWQWLVVLITFITTYALASGSLEYMQKNGHPYIDFTPLQENRMWQIEWLGEDSKSLISGSIIVVFMSPECSRCKDWLGVLKLVQWQDDLPAIVGLIDTENIQVGQDFVDKYFLNFPVVAVNKRFYRKLKIEVVPTAVLLENGVIQEKWIGLMPMWFINKINRFSIE